MTRFIIPILQMKVQSQKGQMTALHSPSQHSTPFLRHRIKYHLQLYISRHVTLVLLEVD